MLLKFGPHYIPLDHIKIKPYFQKKIDCLQTMSSVQLDDSLQKSIRSISILLALDEATVKKSTKKKHGLQNKLING